MASSGARGRLRRGAVLFAPGENGEITLTGAIATAQPIARYTLLGRSLPAAPDAVEVKMSLRRASLRDGRTSTVLSRAKSPIVTLDGLDLTSSGSKRFEIDVGSFFCWVQFQMRVPVSTATDRANTRWGLLGVSLRRH